ncbi:hypothetical protein [Methylorubrum aminovorans]|uniref:hypothetical protein n=1 Tax=Methylorubrum aminovorans TaxID=269069 RepID=UPI003C2E363C
MNGTVRRWARAFIVSVAAFALEATAAANAQEARPTKVGTCARTTIASISGRFREKLTRPTPTDEGDGTIVNLKNNANGASYDFVEAVYNSKVGDRVLVCLVHVPTGCPEGDTRGKYYTTTNLRTLQSWTLMNDTHGCGGA